MAEQITTDRFYLAAYLIERGILLKEHSRSEDRSMFVFEQEGVNDLINEYYLDQARISPRRFATAIRNLKTIMYTTSHNTKSTNNNDSTEKGHPIIPQSR